MKKTIFHYAFVFLGAFFATIIITFSIVFFNFYQQVSIMSNLISVSQHDNYKIYVYTDKPIPTSRIETICLAQESSDIKASVSINKPNLFNTNVYSIGVIGKVANMCDNNQLNKWDNIEWTNDGVSFGKGAYFLNKQSLPHLNTHN